MSHFIPYFVQWGVRGQGAGEIFPRVYRTILSQLRSGHFIVVNHHRGAIGVTPDPCPAFGSGNPHTVPHLFSSLAHLTELVARDLWVTTCPDGMRSVLHPFLPLSLCSSPTPAGASTKEIRPPYAGPLTPAEEDKEKDLDRGKQRPPLGFASHFRFYDLNNVKPRVTLEHSHITYLELL